MFSYIYRNYSNSEKTVIIYLQIVTHPRLDPFNKFYIISQGVKSFSSILSRRELIVSSMPKQCGIFYQIVDLK